MRIILYSTILFSLLLAGCGSSVTTSRTAIFKDPSNGISELKIHAKADTGSFGSAITIFANNKEIIKGDLNIGTGIGHFSGEYDGKAIDAECSLDQRGIAMFNRCTIFIDSKEFTELTF